MGKWFSNDPNGDGFVIHDSEEKAREAAEKALQHERDAAEGEEWSEEVEDIFWGEVKGHVVRSKDGVAKDHPIDYELVPTVCTICGGKGGKAVVCSDPQCGDSTWDHDCEAVWDPCPVCMLEKS